MSINYGTHNIFASGQIDAFNALQMRPSGTETGNTSPIRFYELAANGSNYVGFKAANSIDSNLIWTLPSGDGTDNQVLRTDGSGNLGWINLGGATGSGGGISNEDSIINALIFG